MFFVNFIRSVKQGPANGENRKDKKTNIDPVVPPWGQVGLYNLKRQSLKYFFGTNVDDRLLFAKATTVLYRRC